MKTLPKKTWQVLAMEGWDTEKRTNRTESIHTVMVTLTNYSCTHEILYCEQNNREGMWLLVVLSKDFLVKGTAPAKKKPICAEIKINT